MVQPRGDRSRQPVAPVAELLQHGQLAQLGRDRTRELVMLEVQTPSRDSWPNSGGIGPVNRLLSRYSNLSQGTCPNSAGIGPLSWLPERTNHDRKGAWLNSGGIGPVSRLFWRFSCAGILPVNGDTSSTS